MSLASTRSAGLACMLAAAVLPTGVVLEARQPPPPQKTQSVPGAPAATTPAVPAPPVGLDLRSAEDTRRRLHEVLDQYPPTLQRVLQLDPSLLGDERYLASYPTLQAYLAAHAEVIHHPAYFIGEAEWQERITDPGMQALRTWERLAESLNMFLVFLVLTGATGWLVRTLMDYRRWLRVSKVQADTHAKLLDRLTSNDDLLAYVQSSAGRKFLESAPIPLDAGPRSLGAPLGRILWSVQAGLVLAFGGLGLQLASRRVGEFSAPPLAVLGTLALALGAGFVVSALVAFVLSRRLGLLDGVGPAAANDGKGAGVAS